MIPHESIVLDWEFGNAFAISIIQNIFSTQQIAFSSFLSLDNN
jgi:hypothetical protein